MSNSNTSLDKLLKKAISLHRAGNLGSAENIYRKLLLKDARHPDANYLLGLIELERSEYSAAENRIRLARDTLPQSSLYQYNLGRALQGLGKLDEAEQCYRSATRLQTDYLDAEFSLAFLLQERGELQAAITIYHEICANHPNAANAFNNLGNALVQVNRTHAAVKCLRRAIKLSPGNGDYYANLGNALGASRDFNAAMEAYQQSLQLAPDDAATHFNYANLLRDIHQIDQAIVHFRRAIELQPALAAAYNNLGNLYKLLGNIREAIEMLEKAHGLSDGDATTCNNLGTVYVESGYFDKATEMFERAINLNPDYCDTYSNLLYSLHYPANVSEQDLYERHKKWAERFETPFINNREMHLVENTEGRPIRIGYVSGDFRRHSVAYFFETLLKGHNKNRFKVYLYSNVLVDDEVSHRLRERCDFWRPIIGIPDDEAAAQIRQDQIDILIDLSGHTNGNRLLLMARKPAPIQVTWLGYPNTTGLSAIDYRFSDQIADPEGLADQLCSEKLYRLPNGFLCYHGFEQAPAVNDSPLLKNAYVTFGSFNNLTKVTQDVVGAWSRILQALPGSRLLLKSKQLDDRGTRDKYIHWFEEEGIQSSRLDLRGRVAGIAEHLAVYRDIDIGLDPMPYNGTTTTCEALWMGVPVISVAGDCHRARVGASILHHAGLTELIVKDETALLAKIKSLTDEPDQLNALRTGLRQRLLDSPLCDEKGFARQIEDAYESMLRAKACHSDKG